MLVAANTCLFGAFKMMQLPEPRSRDPYDGFRRDRERLLALVSRDIRIFAVALARCTTVLAVLALAPAAGDTVRVVLVRLLSAA
jgi:hypothetical protein